MPNESPYEFLKIGGGGGGSSITCPFALTAGLSGVLPFFSVGQGMVNNVLCTFGMNTPFFPSAGDGQMIVASVDVSSVVVNTVGLYLGFPGDPPSPQEDFPESSLTIPIYAFDANLTPIRLIGCNNIMVFPHTAFIVDNDTLGDPTAYPYTNWWNWAIWC